MNLSRDEADPEPAIPPEQRSTEIAIYFLMAAILVLTSLPQLVGWYHSSSDQIYTGLLSNNLDILSYYAKMREGMDGYWSYHDPFTTEPHRRSFLFVFYVFLGHLTRWFGLSIIGGFHLWRVLSGVVLLFAVNRFLKTLGFRGGVRILIFLYAFLAEGWGWALPLIPNSMSRPMEFWVLEAYTFQSMMNYPHFPLSTALMVLAFDDLYRLGARKAPRYVLARLGLVAFLMSWVHPRLILTIFGSVGFAGLWGYAIRKWPLPRWIPGLVVLLVAGLPPGLAIIYSYRGDPVWEQWANIATLAQHPYYHLAGFGLLWPLAIYGAWKGMASGKPWAVYVVSWFLVGAALPYFPTDSQRRLLQGFNIPLAILAGYGVWQHLLPRLRGISRSGARIAYAVGVLISSFLMLSTFDYLKYETQLVLRGEYPWFYGKPRADAMAWLNTHTRREDVILSSLLSGIFIPSMAGNRVVIGHWAETMEHDQKAREVTEFFDASTTPARREKIVARHDVRYVFLGPYETALGSYSPAQEPEKWSAVWNEGPTTIFARRNR